MTRQYEISLWDHNDNFLEILGATGEYYRNEAYSPIMTISNKAESKLTFTIPIIYYRTDIQQWVNNERWYDELVKTRRLVNEKKVKVIFDKLQKTNGVYSHKIFEFVITNINEFREGRQLLCQVECTGLPFRDLAKKGQKIVLDSETVLLDEKENNIVVYPTMDYWCSKIFPRDQYGQPLTLWDYEVRMDYSAYAGSGRESTKIYEEEDIISWEEITVGGEITGLVPQYSTVPIEKMRFPSIDESNIFNITQDLAELFEVFVAYEYQYDDATNPFKITGRKVVFFNDVPHETEYAVSYTDNLTGFTRTMNSDEMTTKLYVEPIESEYSNSGLISIADAVNNKTRDDFLLNFSYYESAGLLTNKQSQAIPEFEINIRKANTVIIETQKKLMSIQNDIDSVEVEIAILDDRLAASQTTLNDYTEKMAALNTALTTNVLSDTKVAAIAHIVGSKITVTIKRAGIIRSSLVVTNKAGTNITYTVDTDAYGYVTAIYLTAGSVTDGTIVYLTYDYDLLSYYRNEIVTYTSSIQTIMATKAQKQAVLGDSSSSSADINGTLYQKLNYYNKQYKTQLTDKEKLIRDFDNIMGYYLKEGKWAPDDYEAPTQTKEGPMNVYNDLVPFDGEQLSWYYSDAQLNKKYYNYIIATNIPANVPSLEELVLYETWTENGITYNKQYLFNAHYTPQMMSISGTPTFIFLLGQDDSLGTGHTLYYKNTSGNNINITSSYRAGGTETYAGVKSGNTNPLMYKRITINDDNVIISSAIITVKNVLLDEYYDYTSNFRDDKVTITLKINNKVAPNVTSAEVQYKIDRTTSQYYLDAITVSKTSAMPKASYEVGFAYLLYSLNPDLSFAPPTEYKLVGDKLNDTIDLSINMVIRIYDNQLKFNGVKGIVSEVSYYLEQRQNDSFLVQNYKTRFEDLFGRVRAASEQILLRGTSYDRAADAITSTQEIKVSILQNTISRNNLILTSGYMSGVIFDDEGIRIENTYPYSNGVTGLVMIRGGGIFMSNRLDADGYRLYTLGITPEGINASALTMGRLDTEKVNIYSGDQVRFTWKAEGLFAYSYGQDGYDTDFNKWVRFNEDGLLFSKDNGVTKTLALDWEGLQINSEDGSLKLNPVDGLEISGQDGAIKLTSKSGLKIFDAQTRLKVWLGKFAENAYGLSIYDNNGSAIFRSYDNEGQGRIWVAGNLDVGFLYGTTQATLASILAGVSGNTTGSLFTDAQVAQYNLSDNIPAFQLDTSIRFYSGYKTTAYEYQGYTISVPTFTVLHDGTLYAADAHVSGAIYAESGYFSGELRAATGSFTGDITATSGTFSGVIHAKGGTIDDTLTVTTGSIIVGDSGLSYGSVKDTDGYNVLFWLGGQFNSDGELSDSALQYTVEKGLVLKGTIEASATNITSYMYLQNGIAGLGVEGVPTVDYQAKDLRFWSGADTSPTLNIDTSKDSYWYVTAAGEMAAKKATIDGTITVQSGVILGDLIVDSGDGYTTMLSGLATNPVMRTTFTDPSDVVTTVFSISRAGKVLTNDLTLTGNLHVQNDTHMDGNLIIADQSSIMSQNYISGATGWYIGYGQNNYYAEFVNAKFRGELTSSVFSYDTISAVGGELWVRPSIILVADVSLTLDSINGYSFIISKGQYRELNSFKNGQRVVLQALVLIQGTGATEDIQLSGECTYMTNDDVLIHSIDGAIDVSTIQSILAGSSVISEVTGQDDIGIKLTAIDEFGPYIDIYSGENTSIVRVGNLQGIHSQYFGSITGYGLYAADAYLTGKLYLPNAGITNEGNVDSSVRLWAGSAPEDMNTAPFRVLQDGSMYAKTGVFEGQIIAGSGSIFSGAIHAAGVVIDDSNDNHFFVAYTDNPLTDDDYVINIDKNGIAIFEGALHVYSDWANGENPSGTIIPPYGGTNKYPYFTMNDEKMRFISQEGHFYSVSSTNTYKSVLIGSSTIWFREGNIVGSISQTENTIVDGTSFLRHTMLDGLSIASKRVAIQGNTSVDIVAADVNVAGDITNTNTVETVMGKMLIKYTDDSIEFYYAES